MEIGRRIYYDLATGNPIQDTGERSGSVVETTQEQDFASYVELAERVPSTVGMIQLAYGELAQDFAECNGFHVNITTTPHTLEFSYPTDPPAPPVYQKPLSEQIAELNQQLAQTNADAVGFQDFIFASFPELA